MSNKSTTKRGIGKTATLESRLTKLHGENRRLRATIDDIWNVVNDDEPVWSELPTRVSGLISNSLPKYKSLEAEALPGDASQDAALLLQDAEEKKLTHSVAAEMGLTAEEFSNSQDVNAKLMALRRVLFRQYQLEMDPAAERTDAEYLSMVASYFTIAVGLTANFPLSLKKEAIRFIKALEKIRNSLPKGNRGPAPDVEVALEMIENGYKFKDRNSMKSICESAIAVQNGHKENYAEMRPDARRLACNDLKKRIDSLFRQRKIRAIDVVVKQLVENGETLDDPQLVDTLCRSTITVHNGYNENYSSMSSATAKRSAVLAFRNEVASRLSENRDPRPRR